MDWGPPMAFGHPRPAEVLAFLCDSWFLRIKQGSVTGALFSDGVAQGDDMTQSNARERIERFAQAFRDGDIDTALALIDALIDERPDHAPLYWHRARTLKAMHSDAEALAAVKRLIELKPDYAPAWLMRAELSASDADGNYPESDLRRALELDPGLAPACCWRRCSATAIAGRRRKRH